MKRKLFFIKGANFWNKMLQKFQKLYKRIQKLRTEEDTNEKAIKGLTKKLQTVYKKLEKMQHKVGIKIAATAIMAMLLTATATTHAQTFNAGVKLQFAEMADMEFDYTYTRPTFADIDGDGDLDLFVGNANTNGAISIYTNNAGTFEAAGEMKDASDALIDVGFSAAPAFADLDNDGDLDLYIGESDGTINVYTNDGTNKFTAAGKLQDSNGDIDVGSQSRPAFANLDGDGDLDLYVGEYYGGYGAYVEVFENTGTISSPVFAAGSNIVKTLCYKETAPAFADIDGDGNLDLYWGAYNLIYVCDNDGTVAINPFSTDSGNASLGFGDSRGPAFADIDDDGDLDLYVGAFAGPYSGVKVQLNDGSGNFGANAFVKFLDVKDIYTGTADPCSYSTEANPVFANLDADADLELYTSFRQCNGHNANIKVFEETAGDGILILKSNNDDNFVHQGDDAWYARAAYFAAPTFANLDGDGDLDLYIGTYSGKIEFHLNEGSGGNNRNAFAEAGGHGSAPYLSSIDVGRFATPTFADIDADGDLDLFVGNYYGKIYVFTNTGGVISSTGSYLKDNTATDIEVINHAKPTFADLDGDGDLDLYVGNANGYIEVFTNNDFDNNSIVDGDGVFTAAGKMQAGGSDVYVGSWAAPTFADRDGDGDLDLYVGDGYGYITFFERVMVASPIWEGDDATNGTDWDTQENWSTNTIPTITDDVEIPAGCPEYPLIDETANCNLLYIEDGASLSITTGAVFTVDSDITLGEGTSGELTFTDGIHTFNGTVTLGANCTVKYNGDAQDMETWAYQNLIVESTGTKNIMGATSTPTTCENLTINDDDAVLVIAAGKALTVSNTLTSTQTVNTGLVVKSSATGDGSLIFDNAGIKGTVERYLSKTNGEEGQWHFIGAPITTAPVSMFDESNFYQYKENADDWWTGADYFWNDPSGWQKPTGNLNVAQGYNYYYYISTLHFAGEINYNAAGYTTTAGYTTHAGNAANGNSYTNYDGWLLVSNPYPSSLDWTQMNLTDVNNTVYYYDDNADNYKYFNGTGGTQTNEGITVNGGSQYISMGQGFFVKSDNAAGTGTFTIPNTARVHNSVTFVKEAVKSPNNLIRLQLDYNNYSDEMVLHFNENATADFDSDYDAYKRFSWNADVPQIYSLNNEKNTELAINVLEHNISQTIPLGYKVGNNEQYTIKVTELNDLEFDFIFLEDLEENILINLFKHNEYSFIPKNTKIENDRFLLHFGKNQAPTIVSDIENQEVLEDSEFNLNVKSTFEDYDMEDSFTVNAKQSDGSNLPAWLAFNSETETFTGTPLNEDVGTLSVKLIATDSYGGVTEVPFDIEIINTNDAPIVSNTIEDQIAYENVFWTYQFASNVFSDIDPNDQLTYTARLQGEEFLPAWINFEPAERTFTANANNNNIGIYTIELIATDQLGESVITSFDLDVLSVNGVKELNATDYYVYPNPSNGIINIYSEQGFTETNIIISNITGTKLYESNKNSSTKKINIDLSSYQQGIYIISIIKSDKTITKRITIGN